MSHSTCCFCYAVLVVCLVMVPMVFDVPGSSPFFFVQAFLWGVGTYYFTKARQSVWEEKGALQGYPSWIRAWKQSTPIWAYEATFLIQLVNLPFACAMLYRIAAMGVTDASSWTLSDHPAGSDLWLEHVIFASLFGFMCRDLVLHWRKPDLMFVGHHILVSILMLAFSFATTVPGIRLLAFATPAVELGSAAYCHWILWRCERLYTWVMNGSNAVMMAIGTLCLYNCEERLAFHYFLWLIAVFLSVGRTAALRYELSEWYRKEEGPHESQCSNPPTGADSISTGDYPACCGCESRSRVDSDTSTAASESD